MEGGSVSALKGAFPDARSTLPPGVRVKTMGVVMATREAGGLLVPVVKTRDSGVMWSVSRGTSDSHVGVLCYR